jgi:hypothetical protein
VGEPSLPGWDIEEGIRNAEAFFRALPKLFPDATLFVAEGHTIGHEVATFYRQHAVPDVSRPPDLPRFHLVPRYLCACTPEFFLELARLAARTPRQQILHHLYLYRGASQLIYWHDAFANALFLSSELPETTVAALAQKFGVRHSRARV